MLSIIFGVLLVIAAVGAAFGLPPTMPRKLIALGGLGVGTVVALAGGVSYNDNGYCTHIRTAFGTETSKCDVGWYFSGWGNSTLWPHAYTVMHTTDENAQGNDNTVVFQAYNVRLADNWAGRVSQTTRFVLPQNEAEFFKLVREFRTPERLANSLLVPTVNSTLDTVANLFTMEEYYAGGERDSFKKEYQDTLIYGPAETEKIVDPVDIQRRVSANLNSVAGADTNDADAVTEVKIVEKKTDEKGKDIRPEKYPYTKYGIVAASAIISNLDPDDRYEEQIQKRKDAISRRVIAVDQRKEQEEQRLLAIAEADTNVAKEAGEARKLQIKQTTDAETTKKLAIIKSEQQQAEAEIAKNTAAINLEKAEIDAKAKVVTAEADAKSRELAIAADNALQSKIDAEIQIQTVWAEAYANRNVPQIVFGGGKDGAPTGADTEVQDFFKLMNAQAAKSLSYNRSLEEHKQ